MDHLFPPHGHREHIDGMISDIKCLAIEHDLGIEGIVTLGGLPLRQRPCTGSISPFDNHSAAISSTQTTWKMWREVAM